MPSPDTFTIPPIAKLVHRWLKGCREIVDPFARNSSFATISNDLNPKTKAMFHLDAIEFLNELRRIEVVADAVIFDPPYSPRQTKECYEAVGREMEADDSRNSILNKRVRLGLSAILRPGGIAISCGWNSSGLGRKCFSIREILLVAHGGAHNDTIVVVESKNLTLFDRI